jgi:hypothetical protein
MASGERVLRRAGVIFNLYGHHPFPVIRGLRLSNRCQDEVLSIAVNAVTNPQALPNHLLELCYWYFVPHGESSLRMAH